MEKDDVMKAVAGLGLFAALLLIILWLIRKD